MNPNVGKYTYSEVKKMTIFDQKWNFWNPVAKFDIIPFLARSTMKVFFSSFNENFLL